ncbi:patatin-like phospholipase family protein [Planomonospora parontospora]|uniref:patatin-like phospholipase family protein n=1 Tax=Planomonospora parontospora TaxID=58119 RepID=UPI00166FB6E1|nr:patatin-like phospholipase family protein [Planomonospora parontospora]GGL03167.1 patatin [Planomonospora parontospora subsp. antibiotica]GII13327.1 patatin [Planomonospora parontospora subsp. antibiotica]
MTRALVLGGGGVAGIAWEAGVVTGLRRAGVDLGEADLVVGTSAGSVVGALVSTGADLESAVAVQAGSETRATVPAVDMEAVMAAFGILYDPSLDPREARRRVGAMALSVEDTGARIETIGERLPVQEWPERRLLITAVDCGTGEFVVWERGSGVPMVTAVASSCAVPCVFPPVEIGGRRYMDGGVRSATNADLAEGSSAVVVLEPLAHLSPRARFTAELARLGDAEIAHVVPDEASAAVFGANVLDPSLWRPAFDAGLAQAPAVAEAVRKAWC